jgi:hypothetical protein
MPVKKSTPTWAPRFEVHEWFYGLATEWAKCLRTSSDPAAATKALVHMHEYSIKEDPERAIFWLMLAFYQCRDGCLQPLVRRRALAVIDRGPERVFWLDGSPSTPSRRRKDYDRMAVLIKKSTVKANPRRKTTKRPTRAKK